MKKSGGKRAGAGRPLKNEKTKTVSFRVLEYSENEIKKFFKKLNAEQRTKLLNKVIFVSLVSDEKQNTFEKLKERKEKIFNDLLKEILNEREEIINSPIRFNGVHVERIKQIFKKYGIDNTESF